MVVGLTVLLVAYSSNTGYERLQKKYYEELEWDHPPLQTLMRWIRRNVPEDAVISCDMGMCAQVNLATGRTVTNHPHYESEDIRARTKFVYEMFGCHSQKRVRDNFVELGTDFVIVFDVACRQNAMHDDGCTSCHYESPA